MRKKTLVLSGTASVIAAAGAFVTLGLAPASGDPSAAPATPTARVWSTSVTGNVGGATARRTSASASAAAAAARPALGVEAENPDLDLNTAQARTVSSPSASGGAWTVVPGSGGACVVLSNDGVLCGDDATFASSGAAISWTTPPPVRIHELPPGQEPGPGDTAPATSGDIVIDGIAVDEVRRADVLDQGGAVVATTAVKGSVFTVSVPVTSKPSAVRIVGADGGFSVIQLR